MAELATKEIIILILAVVIAALILIFTLKHMPWIKESFLKFIQWG